MWRWQRRMAEGGMHPRGRWWHWSKEKYLDNLWQQHMPGLRYFFLHLLWPVLRIRKNLAKSPREKAVLLSLSNDQLLRYIPFTWSHTGGCGWWVCVNVLFFGTAISTLSCKQKISYHVVHHSVFIVDWKRIYISIQSKLINFINFIDYINMMKYHAPIEMMFQKSIKSHENSSRYKKASYQHSWFVLVISSFCGCEKHIFRS